jgi:uncharacterized protein YecT (DUF1311 family)
MDNTGEWRCARLGRGLLLCMALLPGPLLGAVQAQSQDPCQMGSAMALSHCHQPAWEAAEAELQSRYDQLQAALREQDATLAVALRDAQRSWIRQREQSCSLYARSRVQGSPWTGFWDAECRAQQARQRSHWLKMMLEGP